MSDSSIYIELELFLDPAITDPQKLNDNFDQKISEWNKKINAKPEYKQKVFKAKEFKKNGLAGFNLRKQADQAKNQKLKELRKAIENLELGGPINEKGFNHLKNSFKFFLRRAQ